MCDNEIVKLLKHKAMINTKIKNILVPLDFSEASLNALETAIAIAKQQNSNIMLLNVADSSFIFGFKGVYYISEKQLIV